MTINLFPDQLDSITRSRSALKRNKSVLLRGETGSGKSVMAAYMIKSSQDKGSRAAFIVPRKELVKQMAQTFSDFNIPFSFVASGHQFNPHSLTHICSTGTLVNRLDKINPQIVFVDECHYSAEQNAKIINHYKARGAFIVGLSATPKAGLDKYYDDMVDGLSLRQLIDLKRLSDYRLFAPSRPDLSGIKTVAGEYHQGQIAAFMEDERVLVGDAINHYKKLAEGKLNLAFCTSIKHSQITNEMFKDAGIPSAHMDGTTPNDERRRIARAYANRELLNICSVDILTFGYDLSSASGVKNAVIESMSDLSPTKSLQRQRQKNGRVFRYKDYPATISDHAGNAFIHGMPDADIVWSIKTEEKTTKKSSERAVPVRQCSRCYWVSRPTPVCENCGFVHPVQSREVEQVDGELQEIDKAAIIVQNKREQGSARTLEQLIVLGKSKGYKNPVGWANYVYNARNRK